MAVHIIIAMEKELITKSGELFYIMSDTTRLNILLTLLDDNKCCCHDEGCSCGCCEHKTCMIQKSVLEISSLINASQSLVSHQLKVLKDANIVAVEKQGTRRLYSLKDGHIKQLLNVVFEHVKEEQ